jgi:hypothetical protein
MSEYQFYDFRAIDRPLTSSQRTELGKIWTRAEISSTRFANFYTFGDFKGNPVALIERYFDAFLDLAPENYVYFSPQRPTHCPVPAATALTFEGAE